MTMLIERFPRKCVLALAVLLGFALAQPAEAPAQKFGKRTLQKGMRGTDVKVLQRNLTRLKHRTKRTGRYNKQTVKKMKALERRRKWRVDGRMQRIEAKRIKKMVAKQRERKRARQLTAAGPYRFPVGDPHNFGGASARFGAPRSGHSHQGQDVFAPCGTQVYAAQAGNIKVNAYQSSAGNYLVIDGADGTDTAYMHLIHRPAIPTGTWVKAGWHIGNVGESGNASGCHLHFEHWTAPGWYEGGSPYDPLPELQYWDSYS